jgi:hypothetical protein
VYRRRDTFNPTTRGARAVVLDAATKQPFGYEVIGDAVSLTCPSVELAPPS